MERMAREGLWSPSSGVSQQRFRFSRLRAYLSGTDPRPVGARGTDSMDGQMRISYA